MRATKRFERRIIVPYFKVGELSYEQNVGAVTLEASTGVPFEYLRVKGKTIQKLPNRAEQYFSQIKDATSYSYAGVTGAYCLALPSEFVGKDLIYKLNKIAEPEGVQLYLADGNHALFSNLTPLCDSSGMVHTVRGSNFTHFIFTNVYTSDKENDDGSVSISLDGIIDFWQSWDLSVVGEISPDYYTPVLCVGDQGARLYFETGGSKKIMLIPKEITLQNTHVPLLLSAYDELVIKLRENKVIYREGSATIKLTGNELWNINTGAFEAGLGFFASCQLQKAVSEGYCPYLSFASWPPQPMQKNIFSLMGNNILIKFEGENADGISYRDALNEITTFLKEKYNANQTVSIIAKRNLAIEHDITKTSLGATLLNVMKKGTSGEITALASIIPVLELAYYSSIKGASVTLTILLQDEGGNEIAAPIEYTIRKGSAYTLNAPKIDGYIPMSAELWGAVKEDKTIIIRYEEKK